MSDDFTRRREDRNNYGTQTNSQTDSYQGDPWAEQRDLKEQGGCGFCGCACGVGCLAMLLTLILGGVSVYYASFKGVPLQITPETTVLTEPLKNDGKSVDFFTVIRDRYEPKVGADENGFKTVLTAYGKSMFKAEYGPNRDWQFDETCRAFGLDSGFEPSAVYEKPTDYLKAPKPSKRELNRMKQNPHAREMHENMGKYLLLAKLGSAPWKLDDQPKMKTWLDKVGPGLDIVREAAMKDQYFFPMIRRGENELCLLAVSPEAIRFHDQLFQGLRIRAMLRLGEGELDEAWKDIFATIRLSRLLLRENHPQAVTNIMILSTQNWRGAQTFLQQHNGTDEQLARYISDLEALPGLPDRKPQLEKARFIFLDAMAAAHDTERIADSMNWVLPGSGAFGIFSAIGFNWNIIARHLNERFDEFEKRLDEQDPEKLMELFDTYGQELFVEDEIEAMPEQKAGEIYFKLLTVKGRSEQMGQFGVRTALMMQNQFFRGGLVDEINRQLLRIAFALDRYKLKNEKYPDSLDELGLEPVMPILSIEYQKTEDGFELSALDIELAKPEKSSETEIRADSDDFDEDEPADETGDDAETVDDAEKTE